MIRDPVTSGGLKSAEAALDCGGGSAKLAEWTLAADLVREQSVLPEPGSCCRTVITPVLLV